MFELLVSFLVVSATPFSPAVPASATSAADEAVERAARDYRIQVYDTFHRNRPEYDSRSEAGNRVLSGYRRSGRHPEHGEIVKDWFAEARGASSPGEVRPLPQLPDFAADLATEPIDAGRTAENMAIDGRQQASSDTIFPATTSPAAAERGSIESSVAAKVVGVMLRAAMRTPYDSTSESVPELQIDIGSPVVDGTELETDESISPMLVDARDMLPLTPDQPTDVISDPTETPEAIQPTTDPQPVLPDADEVADQTAAPEASAPPASGPTQPAADEHVATVPSAASQQVALRVTRFNDSLSRLVEETEADSPAKLFDVARLLNDLVDLAEQRPEIASQLETLPQAEQEMVPQLLSIEPAVTGLQATIDKTRSELDTDNFFGSDAERQQAQELLNVLEKQLQALATGA
jgi:hypothetical protein